MYAWSIVSIVSSIAVAQNTIKLVSNVPFSTATYSTVHSPSWAATWFAASQEIPRISRNPKVHYRTHKRPPPVFYCHYHV